MKWLLQTYISSSYSGYCRLIHPAATERPSKFAQKRFVLVNRRNVVLHDNARPHTARVTQEHFFELGWSILPHPPYSPDLSPSDYHLFRSLKNSLMGTNFSHEDQVREFVENLFTSKLAEFLAKGIEELPDKWQQVIAYDGEYIID